MAGERIGDYVIERELGSGGMGAVYLGRSRSGRPVAVKVIKPEFAADQGFRERFRREVEAAKKVGGFHAAAVVDADPEATRPWMASAYIEGPTLADELGSRGPLSERRLWTLAAELAEALGAIHSCGLVHRDLKPANIVLAADGVRVLDFGIARAFEGTQLTGEGGVIGTPGYLAPEQALGRPLTGACDVFALGAVLVAAAGGSAFGGGGAHGLMYRAVHEDADVSAVPEPLRPVVLACLEKEPARRPTPRRLLDLCADRIGHVHDRASEVAEEGDSVGPSAEAAEASEAAEEAEPTAAYATYSPTVPDDRTKPAPPPAPPMRVAAYRRRRASWLAQVGRNAFVTLGLATVGVKGTAFGFGDSVAAGAGVAAFFLAVRLVGLLTSAKDGLVLADLGIGVGPGNDLVVLRWDKVRSVDLVTTAKETTVAVRLDAEQRLPNGFQHPAWVRSGRDGVIRIRTKGLVPVGDSPPLTDAIRARARRHHVPLTPREES
ncbi:protein kinase [Streptomyces sp. NBC_00090]|uniref:protein kinase domain-containing protein n=1 Tax=Streptomyces sp. NBC_00090 TaxID=2903619 RepID=UPI0032463B27